MSVKVPNGIYHARVYKFDDVKSKSAENTKVLNGSMANKLKCMMAIVFDGETSQYI